VSVVGLGCATTTPFCEEPGEAGIDTVRHAREIGVDFHDSSDVYG
jgi:aryl-alcohol dehydrogenase-like predicted oxidoreductase